MHCGTWSSVQFIRAWSVLAALARLIVMQTVRIQALERARGTMLNNKVYKTRLKINSSSTPCCAHNRCAINHESGDLVSDCSNLKCSCFLLDGFPVETTTLILDRNLLSILKDNCFHHLFNLRRLSLIHNRIVCIKSRAFESLFFLQHLNLSSNPIVILPPFLFTPLANLRILILRNISVNGALFSAEAFENLTKLETLNFGANKETTFPQFRFQNRSITQSLSELILSSNYIRELKKSNFQDLKSIHVLSLANNKIQTIQPYCFADLTNLRELTLIGNKLGALNQLALVSSSLQLLNLGESHFKLQHRNQAIFAHLPKLTKLVLKKCRFHRFVNLKTILRNSTQLRELHLQNCRLKHEQLNKLLINSRRITILYLTANDIISLDPSIFERMSGTLEALHLSHNRIQTLNQTSLPQEVWNGLKTIDLSGNPWNCDCKLIWFRK